MKRLYSKVLKEVKKVNNAKTLHNKLVDLCYSSEDYALRNLIMKYKAHLFEAMKYSSKSPTYNAIMMSSIADRDALIDYCSERVREGKPEWQVLAERNGWVKKG